MAPVAMYPVLEMKEDCLEQAKALAVKFTQLTQEKEADTCIYYAWGFCGTVVHVQEVYTGVEGLKTHMANIADLLTHLPKILSCIKSAVVQCAAEDVEAIQAMELEKSLGPGMQIFVMDTGIVKNPK